MGIAKARKAVSTDTGMDQSGVFDVVEARNLSNTSFSVRDEVEFNNILTGIGANIDWLVEEFQGSRGRADVVEALQDVKCSCRRLVWLSREAAVLEGRDDGIVPVPVPLERLMEEAAAGVRLVMPEGSRAARFAALPNVRVHVDFELAARLLERLVECALRSAGGRSVDVAWRTEGKNAVCDVASPRTDRDGAAGEPAPSSKWPETLQPPAFCLHMARLHDGSLTMTVDDERWILRLVLPIYDDETARRSQLPGAIG